MDRLARLEQLPLAAGGRLLVARSYRQRLLGLAWLGGIPDGHALLLPGCASVHTVGMRFALDVGFLDQRGRVIEVVRGLRPWRLAACRGAAAAVETRAGGWERLGLVSGAGW
jgi:uncharacterized membrane protein (UPF0127 family)